MKSTIVVLSGRVSSGKTTLGELLLRRRSGRRFSTSELLQEIGEENGHTLADRKALQDYGEQLDVNTEGLWVANALAPRIVDLPPGSLIVIDSIRVAEQIDGLRRAFGRRVVHVHLTAPVAELSTRYDRRESNIAELPNYTAVGDNPTEAAVESLAARADVVIDTSRCTPADVEVRCAARLGLLADTRGPRVDVLIGGAYGSEGKGNVAFHLAPEYDILIRSGGPNAGHKVPVEPVFTHRLLPSGTLASEDSLLVIAPGATLDLDILFDEIAGCQVDEHRLSIDPRAFVIELDDKIREEAGKEIIGSTGSGAGAATARRILEARLLGETYRTAADIAELKHYLRPIDEVMAQAAESGMTVLLEGTQGSGLSLYHGSYPHVTSRDTNVAALLSETGLPPAAVQQVIMVMRTYPIRVGGESGPMGQEIDFHTISKRSGLPSEELVGKEVGSVSGTGRRVAEFDWERLRKSAALNGSTDIALTFVDYVDAANLQAYRFEQLTPATRELVEEIQLVAGCPVSMLSTNFGHGRGLIDRRAWRGTSARAKGRSA